MTIAGGIKQCVPLAESSVGDGKIAGASKGALWGAEVRRRGTVRVYTPMYDAADGIEICDGVRSASGCVDGGPSFYEEAVIPLGNWRKLTEAENRLVRSFRPMGAHRTVAVVPLIPPAIADQIRHRSEMLRAPLRDSELLEHPILGRMVSAARRLSLAEPPLRYHGLAQHNGGLETVTCDRNRNQRLGLHFDNWEHTGLSDADFVPNRMSINLGPEERYFLFVNLTLKELIHVVTDATREAPQTKMSVVRRFFERFPTYPIVRVRVRPGEAYIAPTENIIHDGSSCTANSRGYHVTIHGRFTPLEPEYVRVLTRNRTKSELG